MKAHLSNLKVVYEENIRKNVDHNVLLKLIKEDLNEEE